MFLIWTPTIDCPDSGTWCSWLGHLVLALWTGTVSLSLKGVLQNHVHLYLMEYIFKLEWMLQSLKLWLELYRTRNWLPHAMYSVCWSPFTPNGRCCTFCGNLGQKPCKHSHLYRWAEFCDCFYHLMHVFYLLLILIIMTSLKWRTQRNPLSCWFIQILFT